MSDEDNKKKKKSFNKWLISSLILTGGGIVGGAIGIAEIEAKVEENEGERENKKQTGSGKKVQITKPVDNKVELTTAMQGKTNLGKIETNGQTLTAQMIKTKLPISIDKTQVDIIIQSGNKATVAAKANSIKYKGSVDVNYILDTKQTVDSAISNKNLGIIETNGQTLTAQMIKTKLPINIKDHVDITIQQANNKATLTAKSTSIKYKGSVDVSFSVDNKIKSQQDTIYIDIYGKKQTTNERDLSNIETKEIIQIGFYQNQQREIQVVTMPEFIEKLPAQLPPEITSLKEMFYKTVEFNQDISKWNVSNVKLFYNFGENSLIISDLNKLPKAFQ